jgi:hypothetical protein
LNEISAATGAGIAQVNANTMERVLFMLRASQFERCLGDSLNVSAFKTRHKKLMRGAARIAILGRRQLPPLEDQYESFRRTSQEAAGCLSRFIKSAPPNPERR